MKLSKSNVLRLLVIFFSVMAMHACDTSDSVDSTLRDYFIRYYGEDGEQTGVDMVLNNDGTMILLGTSTSADKTSNSIFLVKVDPEGNTLWQKKFGGTTELAKDIEPTPDGNFIILSDYTKAADDHEVKLIKVSPDGNKLDSVTYGFSGNGFSINDFPNTVTPLSDNGFIVTGMTENIKPDKPDQGILGEDVGDIFILRCDQNLVFYSDSVMEQKYGLSKLDAGVKVFQRPDQSLYSFSFSNPNTPTNNTLNLFYSEPSQEGKYPNNYIENPGEDITISSVTNVSGQGYFLVGSSNNSSTGGQSLYVAKLRNELAFSQYDDVNVINPKLSIGTRKLRGITSSPSFTAPQGFLILADETDEAGKTNIVLIKVDLGANLVWWKRLGSTKNDDHAGAVIELPDGKIVVTGTIGLDNQTKMALIKLNTAGELLK